MERKTATPVIDGGIVNAPLNTTARHDFAENPQQSQSVASVSSGLDNERMTTAGQQHFGRDNAAGGERAGLASHEQHGYHAGNEAGTTIGSGGSGAAADTRPTSSKLKESASGVKGLAAAVHGAGEMVRGNVNATVDRVLNDEHLKVPSTRDASTSNAAHTVSEKNSQYGHQERELEQKANRYQKAGEAHNSTIATAGEHEVTTGQFSHETKNREGAIPGSDGDRRKTRDLLSRHVE